MLIIQCDCIDEGCISMEIQPSSMSPIKPLQLHATPLSQMNNAFTLQKNSVWNPVQSHVKLFASVHLQKSPPITLERAVYK